jgi:Ca-activated chloride channel family protein
MAADIDYYQRLGIDEDASPEAIRRAYHDAARKLHPDVNVEKGATEIFLDIKEAYEVLIDPNQRAAYDGKITEKRPPPPVRFNTIYSRTELPRMRESQLVYALIEMDVLTDSAEKEKTSQPINVALIIDNSTSMQGARLDVVKAASIELIRQLRDQDILSIISFNDRSEVVLPAGKHHEIAKAESRIRMIQTRGATEIFQGLNSGIFEVRRNLNQNHTNHIILLTDGHTYGDEEACINLIKQAARDKIGVSCLGIGSDWNDEFLDELASQTGGSSVYISDPKHIHTLLLNKFKGLSRVCVERVSYNFRSVQGVELRYAFRINPELGALSTKPPLQLGDIPFGSNQRFLLEFLINPINKEVNRVLLSEGRIAFDIPNGKTPTSYRIPVTLTRAVTDEPKPDPPPRTIVEAMSRLTLYRMQENARADASAGLLEEAVQSLKHLATHLLAKGENELAKTVIMETQHLQQNRRFSDSGEKEIKYGTRSLLLPAGFDGDILT